MAFPEALKEEWAQLDTICKILKRNLDKYGDQVAMRKKRLGIWQEYTWEEVYGHVRRIALGFYSLGAEPGDRVIIIGNNDPELVWAQWGAQHAGLIVSCLYVDYLPDEVHYFVSDCEPRFMVLEDQEQVDKIIRVKDECPSVEKVIYWDDQGLWSYHEPYLMSLEAFEEAGLDYGREHPGLFEEGAGRVKAENMAILIYTSGTTGAPKGSIGTYISVLEYAREGSEPLGIQPGDEYVSYASPAWGEQSVGFAFGPLYPLILSFPEEPETVMADIRDIGPHMVWFAGRQWEDLARQIRVGIQETSFWKRFLFNQALSLGYKRLTYLENGRPVPFLFGLIHKLADFSVLRKVRDYFGMKRARSCGSGGILGSPDLARFFRALGLCFTNLYGTVEIGMLTTTPRDSTFYSSIGKVNPGKQLKIEDGQIWAKVGPGHLGYWNRPGVWENDMKDGWYPTGDAGWIDDEGYVYYIDRISEMSSLKSGYLFSPQLVETRLRFNPYIKDGIVIGADQDYLVAIISCDFSMVGRWAESRHIPYTTLVEMSQLPQVIDLLGEQIIEINNSVPPEIQIQKFISLHKEFDPDEAELTRSRKLKRTVVTEKYDELVRALYDGRTEVRLETEVSYKDGRKAKTSTLVKVNEVYKKMVTAQGDRGE